ncbi:hypothetical protein D5018_03800 [Parashewanella curva]|uniref:Uncharacterized protein n=1 Tax=Parashewanella curva TaxID=2338552 RepID=A0A3L8Q089_9GAMM|nr:hypothetical protein [Parashewanella curva]RLV60975.1 hypothetical protein D5018_03800 [Parashewanella curva]
MSYIYHSRELLDYIGHCVAFSALFVAVFHIIFWKQLESGFIATLAFLSIQSIGLIYKPFVIDHVSPINVDFGRTIYYLGFMALCLITVWMTYKMHEKLEVQIGLAAEHVMKILQFQAGIQVIRLLDRQLGYDWLSVFYQNMIPALNVVIIILLVSSFFKTVKLSKV